MNKEYFSQEFENCVNAMDEDELRAAIFEKARTDRQWQKDIVRQYTQNWLSESVDAEYLKNRIQSMIDQTPWIERDVEWSFGLIHFVDEGVQDAQECDECQKAFEWVEYLYRLCRGGALMEEALAYKVEEYCWDRFESLAEDADWEWVDGRFLKLLKEDLVSSEDIIRRPALLEYLVDQSVGEELTRRLQNKWQNHVRRSKEGKADLELFEDLEYLLSLLSMYRMSGEEIRLNELVDEFSDSYNVLDWAIEDAIEARNFDRVDELVRRGLSRFSGDNKAFLFARRFRSLKRRNEGLHLARKAFDGIEPSYVFSKKDHPHLLKQMGADDLAYAQHLAKEFYFNK